MNRMEENYQLARWLAGEMSEEELKAFRQTPEYATYEKIATYSSQLQAPDFDAESLYINTVSRKKSEPKIIPFYQSKWLKIAAIFVALLALTFILKTSVTSTEVAENGKKRTFYLPDNSEIVLNSGSQIQYKKWNWDNNRKIDLEGEAYFKVAHGKNFEVDTKLGTVTVLGTQFNVKARNDRFDVSCYEGSVRVKYGNNEVVIKKGDFISFGNDYFNQQNITVSKPEWTNNEIVFNKEELQTVVDELERQYNIEIVLDCKDNVQLFSGTIPSDNRKAAFDIVTSIFHLKISKLDADKIILVDF